MCRRSCVAGRCISRALRVGFSVQLTHFPSCHTETSLARHPSAPQVRSCEYRIYDTDPKRPIDYTLQEMLLRQRGTKQ